MQFITLATSNTKGQVVIPKKIREQLNITPDTILQVGLTANSFVFTPVKSVITLADSDSSYLQILEKTHGSWLEAEKPKKQKTNKRNLELLASKNRKQAW